VYLPLPGGPERSKEAHHHPRNRGNHRSPSYSFAKLTGSKVPNDRKIDGKDIDPESYLEKRVSKSPHKIHYYEIDGVRKGDWKLVKKKVKGKAIIRELYDLSTDLGEKKDLAQTKPMIVEELDNLLSSTRRALHPTFAPLPILKNQNRFSTKVGNLPTLQEYLNK